MVSLDKHSQVSSHFQREFCLHFLAVSTESEEGRRRENFDQLSRERYEVLGLGKRCFFNNSVETGSIEPKTKILNQAGLGEAVSVTTGKSGSLYFRCKEDPCLDLHPTESEKPSV